MLWRHPRRVQAGRLDVIGLIERDVNGEDDGGLSRLTSTVAWGATPRTIASLRSKRMSGRWRRHPAPVRSRWAVVPGSLAGGEGWAAALAALERDEHGNEE
jgi:hypothetical protein